MTLSKSQYIRGLQCHKSLWLLKNRPELRTKADAQTESLFEAGYSVGDAAKALFPGGVEVVFDSGDFHGMTEKTKALIEEAAEVIYEATFKERAIFAMADILVKNGDAWDMYEVKASTRVKEYHRNDAAIQWYALSNAISLNRAYIVHIDNRYVRVGALDVNSLFKIVDVTETVKERQSAIVPNLEQIREMLQSDMPDIDIGGHCKDPHLCDFYKHCWQHIPSPSVFNLHRMSAKQKFGLYRQGIVGYHDISDDLKLNGMQRLQVDTAKTGIPHIDKSVIQAFLETLVYPIHFFDFETFQNAIPRFDRQSPYEQIPFQYSLHILHEDGKLEHKEFLGDENSDPRDALIAQMLRDILPTGSIVAYNQSFEKKVIKKLAAFKPARKEALLALNERFVDLIVPFRKRGYYHPDFNGSFSLKSVLPALFPDDEELDYKKLDIQNGGMAMDTFANLHRLKDKSKREEIRSALLAYCRLDTLAMVKLLEKLGGLHGV